MKKYIILFLLLYVANGYAFDNEKLTIEYLVKSIYRTEQPKAIEEYMMLSIGDSISKFCWVPAKEVRLCDSEITNFSDCYWVYKNLPHKGMLTYLREVAKVPYKYTESIPAFDWEMLDDDTVVCGYNCQKARAKFRGRTWTVWFAIDLPYSDGPWKLCGLPGLILKANDAKGHFSFEAIEILKGNGEKIKPDLRNAQNTSPERIAHEMEIYSKDPTKYELDLGRGWKDGTVKINGQIHNYHIDPWEYNFIEIPDKKE